MGERDAPVRLLPVITMVTLEPCATLAGDMLVITGPGELPPVTWKPSALLGPLAVVTDTLRSPETAATAIVKLAVICVGVLVRGVMVTPAIGLMTAPVRLTPSMVTEPLCPLRRLLEQWH